MAIQKKTEGRDLDEYLQEVWDSLESAWDKSKFDMKQGYDSEYECDCITITSKDNEGVLAKIYVNDYEGKHPVGFDVVYRYPGDKGVGVMGSYEFQSTDMDGLGEEVFDYFDEIKKKVGESKKSEADATFKVGDFVNYDAESDGDKLSTGWAFAEVVAVNDDGTLKLQPYNLEDYDEVDGVNPQFCEKMEHFAGMTDANTYYMDGKYNVYKGYYEIYVTTKELGKPYGFAGTLDSLDDVEQLMDYYDETMVYDQDIQDEVMSAVYGLTHYDEEDLKGINFADLSDKTESKKSEGLPPKKLGDRRYRSRADLINKMKQLGAVEITTSKQFNDIKNSQWLHTAGYALDTNGNLVAQSYYGDKGGKWYYTSTRNFDSDYLPESKQHENRTKEEEVTRIFKGMKEWADRWSNSDKDRKTLADNLDLEAVQENMSDIVEILDNNFEWDGYGFKFVVVGDYEDDDTRDEAEANQWNSCYGVCEEIADLIGIPNEGHVIGEMNTYFWEDIEAVWRDDESKKSESLSLKQKELKDMARYGEAEDITTISDAEAKELRKKGIETVGVSRGTYGMNGALLRDKDGKKYVITARSSNLFYFV